MKLDNNHYYRVQDLTLKNVIVVVLKFVDGYMSDICIKKLHCSSRLFNEMTTNVCRLRNLDFSKLREKRIGYADQEEIQPSRVNMATAAIIHYSLHPRILIQYVKGEYVGESRDVSQVVNNVLPYIDQQNVKHISWILTNGCPSYINFEEVSDMKSFIIEKGNHATFKMYPETVTKTMNKEDKHSHLLPLKFQVLHFLPWCCHTAQGMLIKPGKNPQVMFDASTKGSLHEVVLSEFTCTEFEANVDFGHAKMNLLCRIYNWRVSYLREIIFLALADITACFRFPRIHADLTGAFGFSAKQLFFFGNKYGIWLKSYASSWEPFRKAIQSLIPIFSMRNDLIAKHNSLLNMLVWLDNNTLVSTLVQSFGCPIDPGIPDQHSPLKAYIYVDDILASAVGRQNTLQLHAAIIEAIFTVCARTMIEHHQCPLSIDKWEELVIGPIQIILGLTIDTNRMIVEITPEYFQQVLDLLTDTWPDTRRIFKVEDIQKLFEKIGLLGEGASWILKIISHVYTSLAFALNQNELLLCHCSPKFCKIVTKIERKQFAGNQHKFAHELNFASKTALKMVNSHSQVYIINKMMRKQLRFIQQALQEGSKISFEAPIAFIIPRTPSASLFRDSSLTSCSSYPIDFCFWWFVPFPDEIIIKKMLLHLKNYLEQNFVSINVLEYVTEILNYCGVLTAYLEYGLIEDLHLVVLCITDNISAKNWGPLTHARSLL
jgi:hypothetical protein